MQLDLKFVVMRGSHITYELKVAALQFELAGASPVYLTVKSTTNRSFKKCVKSTLRPQSDL